MLTMSLLCGIPNAASPWAASASKFHASELLIWTGIPQSESVEQAHVNAPSSIIPEFLFVSPWFALAENYELDSANDRSSADVVWITATTQRTIASAALTATAQTAHATSNSWSSHRHGQLGEAASSVLHMKQFKKLAPLQLCRSWSFYVLVLMSLVKMKEW